MPLKGFVSITVKEDVRALLDSLKATRDQSYSSLLLEVLHVLDREKLKAHRLRETERRWKEFEDRLGRK